MLHLRMPKLERPFLLSGLGWRLSRLTLESAVSSKSAEVALTTAFASKKPPFYWGQSGFSWS
jgi:hypothetical protein